MVHLRKRHIQLYSTRWNASKGAEEGSWYQCYTTLCQLWKSMAIRWDFPEDCIKGKCHACLQKWKEEGSRELRCDQLHYSHWRLWGDTFLEAISRVANHAGPAWLSSVGRWLDDGRAVDIICFDYSRAFDTVPHCILLINWGDTDWIMGC